MPRPSVFSNAPWRFAKTLGADHTDVGISLNNLAELCKAWGRHAEAESHHKRALSIYEKALGADHPDFGISLNNLAKLYTAQGRYAEAEQLCKRALAILEKALYPDHPKLAVSLNNLGGLYVNQGRYTDAEPLLECALAVWERTVGPHHPHVAASLNNLAMLSQAQACYAEALRLSTRAVAILSKHLSLSLAQRSGAADVDWRPDRAAFANHIWIAYTAAENEPGHQAVAVWETFRVAQMARTSSTSAAVARMAARFAGGSGVLAAVLREHQDLCGRWRFLDEEIIKAISRTPVERKPAEEDFLRASLDDTARQLDALNTRIAAEFSGYAELSNPRPMRAEVVQDLLAPDEGLVVYLSTQENTWLWVVRHDNVSFTSTAITAEALAAEVMALRARLDPELNPDLRAFPASRAYALYQKVLAPAEPLLDGVDHLMVVPDGPLQSLPLGVLVTRPPACDPITPGDHRDIAWLARDYTITVLPSVSSLRSLRRPAIPSKAVAPFLGIGDPVLQGPRRQERGAMTASLLEKVRELPPLTETGKGLRAIARAIGATEDDLLLGERANEPMLHRTALDRYKVVAFATHGLMAGELEGLAEPALVLTPPAEASSENDGLLTASKIATLKLDADWVILWACNTAAGDGTPDADSLTGLAKAFFYAGARSLLVSHWPVRSKPTVALMTGAFIALSREPSIGRAAALQRSMMAMFDPSKPDEFAHPQIWAPFVLAGEAGRAR